LVAIIVGSIGCSPSPEATKEVPQSASSSPLPVSPSAVEKSEEPESSNTASSTTPDDSPKFWTEALEYGSKAAQMAQSAQSNDDWQLVVTRWDRAITLLGKIPQEHTDFQKAQEKISEYRANLAQAQSLANKPVEASRTDIVVTIAEEIPGCIGLLSAVEEARREERIRLQQYRNPNRIPSNSSGHMGDYTNGINDLFQILAEQAYAEARATRQIAEIEYQEACN